MLLGTSAHTAARAAHRAHGHTAGATHIGRVWTVGLVITLLAAATGEDVQLVDEVHHEV